MFIVVPRRSLSCVDSNSQGEALRTRATRITIGFSIAITLFVIWARFLKGLSILKAMGKQGLFFLKLRAEGIRAFLAGVLFILESGGAMALRASKTYLTDPRQKVEGGFSLRGNSFLYDLVSSIYSNGYLGWPWHG